MRSAALAAALVLLLSAGLRFPGAAPLNELRALAAPCPIKLHDIHLRSRSLEASDPVCATLVGMRQSGVTLLAAAGLSPEQVVFFDLVWDGEDIEAPNVSYWDPDRTSHAHGAIRANLLGIRRIGADNDVASWTMAHELAHAVQFARDGSSWHRWSADRSLVENYRRNRIHEAQADTIGLQLLLLSGYPEALAMRAVQRLSKLEAESAKTVLDGITHPAWEVRLENSACVSRKLAQARESQSARPAQKAAAAIRSAGFVLGDSAVFGAVPGSAVGSQSAERRVLSPLFTPLDFDDDGSLKPERCPR